ncbi:TPA: DNA/RNA helicase domain-containing protein [Streptococcus suis]
MNYLLKGTISDLAKLSADELVTKMVAASHDDHSHSEQESWRQSLYRFIQLLARHGLGHLMLIAEYQLIQERIDALLFGRGEKDQLVMTIVELKQWSRLEDNLLEKVTEVPIKIGHETVYRAHPIFQTNQYRKQLTHHHSFCQENQVHIETLQYLDNYIGDKEAFFSGVYSDYDTEKLRSQLFTKDETDSLITFLTSLYSQHTDSTKLTKEVETFVTGNYVLGSVGLEGMKKILSHKDNAVMLDDQNEIAAQISKLMKEFRDHPQHTTVLIQGGPGTGKTILGLHLLYIALRRGIASTQTALFTFAKSRTLAEVLRKESGIVIPYLDKVSPEEYQVIVIDEAHRMENPQAVCQQLFQQKKPIFVIFLMDQYQRILIKEKGVPTTLHPLLDSYVVKNKHFTLVSQKRSGFQGGYIDQLKKLFFGEEVASPRPDTDFHVSIGLSLQTIDQQLRELEGNGNTVKWFAPYCWDWISRNSNRAKDIIITEAGVSFEKQWNPQNQQYDWYKGTKAHHIDQVGSVYTAQGLDYDYQGFIWWSDLRWNTVEQRWEYDLEQSKDFTFEKSCQDYLEEQNYSMKAREEVLQLALHHYYVLLSRAKKGVFIWFADEATKQYVQQQLQDFI